MHDATMGENNWLACPGTACGEDYPGGIIRRDHGGGSRLRVGRDKVIKVEVWNRLRVTGVRRGAQGEENRRIGSDQPFTERCGLSSRPILLIQGKTYVTGAEHAQQSGHRQWVSRRVNGDDRMR